MWYVNINDRESRFEFSYNLHESMFFHEHVFSFIESNNESTWIDAGLHILKLWHIFWCYWLLNEFDKTRVRVFTCTWMIITERHSLFDAGDLLAHSTPTEKEPTISPSETNDESESTSSDGKIIFL